MSLDPRNSRSWNGFLDLLQPPHGYRLAAAVGTSFGLSFEALVAALLSLSDADGEALADDPVAGTLAITRLQGKVRVLVHPGTVAGGQSAARTPFVALLDRLILQVNVPQGLFHPKVWVLRFEPVRPANGASQSHLGRILVASRNLTTSTSFELGAVFEGVAASGVDTDFCSDLSGALQNWLEATDAKLPKAVRDLPAFVRRLRLDLPAGAGDHLRLRTQGPGLQPLAASLPSRLKRALLVAPFLRADFVEFLLQKTSDLQIVSTVEALDALDDQTFSKLAALRSDKNNPGLYCVTEQGDPEGGFIDGLHAKLLLLDESNHGEATFVGSANATAPAWGIGHPSNVEAMVEMRPGIGIDRFVSSFMRETKSKVHPWVTEYDRESRTEPDAERKAERLLLAALRELAGLGFTIRYTDQSTGLRLELNEGSRHAAQRLSSRDGVVLECAPLLISDRVDSWVSLSELAREGQWTSTGVGVEKLSAFVVMRARCDNPQLERTRLALAVLEVEDGVLASRDDAVRIEVMANADPAAVLKALVGGISYWNAAQATREGHGHPSGVALTRLLEEISLERLLQAVAIEPGLVSEIRQLLGQVGGAPLLKLCDDLEAVIRKAAVEVSK